MNIIELEAQYGIRYEDGTFDFDEVGIESFAAAIRSLAK